MKMIDLAGKMEVLADGIFAELKKNFIKQLEDEDFVTDFIIDVGVNPDKYSDFLDPKITRIALAYKAAMDCFMELDELATFEHAMEQFLKKEEEPAKSEPSPDRPQNHQKVLEFPTDIFSVSEEGNNE
ncbi:MAG TPA: hypothetical protein DIT46_07240 [Gemmatimonadetes bacterium]|nr:hypothetical protein [Gemmatimonadota bacterium]|tara:strand:- start:188 stop:571 length:384 start_codon:yes stop_codon:yes gene_type:complete